MNWKINYWTLITFFLGGSLLFNVMRPQPEKKAKWKKEITNIDQNVEEVLGILEGETKCDDSPDTISTQEAVNRMFPFISKMLQIRRGVNVDTSKLVNKVKLPYNLSFVGLKMRKCETLKIFEKAPDDHAYIILTLEDNPKDTSNQLISAIVSDRSIFDEDGNLDVAKAGGATFFDFLHPCPPICED